MSGDLGTCSIFLNDACRFITQARAWKSKLSPKARALHRIYFYLQVIFESTADNSKQQLLLPSTSPSSQNPTPDTSPTGKQLLLSSEKLDGINDIGDVCHFSDASGPDTHQMITYECIYGVPQSLLVLIHKATCLIREITTIRASIGHPIIPPELNTQCDELEAAIMEWSSEGELRKCGVDNMGHSSDIIRLTTKAFHNALIIYFAQHIRLLSHLYLKSYVQKVLDSMEEVEVIKADAKVLAAPMYWPIFIAASEAFSEDLQRRFQRWYGQVEFYGIEAVRSGVSVLREVWNRGPGTGTQGTSQWKSVVRDTGAILMLS